MDNTPRADSASLRLHKKQFAWQILAPFLVVTVLIAAAAVAVATGSAAGTRTWADVSIIWLILPMLFFALPLVILLGLLIYAVAKLAKITPIYTGKVQGFFAMLSQGIHKFADGAAQPVLWIRQVGAAIQFIFGQKR